MIEQKRPPRSLQDYYCLIFSLTKWARRAILKAKQGLQATAGLIDGDRDLSAKLAASVLFGM